MYQAVDKFSENNFEEDIQSTGRSNFEAFERTDKIMLFCVFREFYELMIALLSQIASKSSASKDKKKGWPECRRKKKLKMKKLTQTKIDVLFTPLKTAQI